MQSGTVSDPPIPSSNDIDCESFHCNDKSTTHNSPNNYTTKPAFNSFLRDRQKLNICTNPYCCTIPEDADEVLSLIDHTHNAIDIDIRSIYPFISAERKRRAFYFKLQNGYFESQNRFVDLNSDFNSRDSVSVDCAYRTQTETKAKKLRQRIVSKSKLVGKSKKIKRLLKLIYRRCDKRPAVKILRE